MEGMIRIDNHGKGFGEVMNLIEHLSALRGLEEKQKARIRLLTEETMEMVKNISNGFEAEVSASIENGQFELRLSSRAQMDSLKRERLQEIVEQKEGSGEISGKIRAILESRYYEDSEKNAEYLEQMGLTRVEAGELEEDEETPKEEEYVWSLQNYGFRTFDRKEDEEAAEEEAEADWAEIGRSIIANLSDDLRIYIFRDRLELIVTKRLEEEETHEAWKIDPELEALKKVPVAKSRIQVKMIQILYGGLLKREKSSETVSVRRVQLPCEFSPKKMLDCVIYEPVGRETEILPSVLLLHGGAFVLPALPYHCRLARTVAEQAGVRVFLPDYDLGPVFKPPVQHLEAYAIYKYLLAQKDAFLIDTRRVALMGDSAGGTLCAALCLMLKDRGEPMPAGQLLFYPSLDGRLTSRSMQLYTDVPVINAKAVKAYHKLLGAKPGEGEDKYKKYRSPVEAESLAGMPPTYVETAEFDCLHDDGILYADRLVKEHVDVVLNETKGTVHAYDMAKDSDVLKRSMEKRIRFLKELWDKNGMDQ